MKNSVLSIIMILACHFFVQPELLAQQRAGAKNTIRTIYLHGDISLDSLTRFVHKQSGIRISFNAGKLGPQQRISFPKGWYAEQALLDFIAKTTNLSWTKFNGYIIFRSKLATEKKPPVVNKTARPSINPGSDKPQPHPTVDRILHPDRDLGAALHFSTIIDSHSLYLALPNTNVIVLPGWKRTINKLVARKRITNIDLYTSINERSGFSLGGFHVRPGLSVTDIIYPDLLMELGWQRLHLMASAGTNFRKFIWGLGLGSVVFRNERSEWQVNAGVRFLGKDAQWSKLDTIEKGIRIDGKLYSVGISWNRYLNQRWLIKLGVDLNLLRTDYTQNGKAATPATISHNENEPEDQFRLIRIPLLLNNTYNSDRSYNNKTWIGLKFGIFYDLRRR